MWFSLSAVGAPVHLLIKCTKCTHYAPGSESKMTNKGEQNRLSIPSTPSSLWEDGYYTDEHAIKGKVNVCDNFKGGNTQAGTLKENLQAQGEG